MTLFMKMVPVVPCGMMLPAMSTALATPGCVSGWVHVRA